jgi:antitoxin component of MazEF toxin-antitoxin module
MYGARNLRDGCPKSGVPARATTIQAMDETWRTDHPTRQVCKATLATNRGKQAATDAPVRASAGSEITLYNSAVVITRKIRKVGNSLMIPLPPETISESGFKEGMEVAIASRPGHVDLEPAGVPDKSLVEFAARFTERYKEDLADLADL